MGRMNPAPVEATAGSNAIAVADQWIKAMQRERSAARLTEKERESQQRLAAACAWVARRPELCVDQQPCGYAVWAALEIRRHFPQLKGAAFVERIQARRRQRLAEAVRRGSFTEAEAEAILAGGPVRWEDGA